jgi:diacylglycerol kinase
MRTPKVLQSISYAWSGVLYVIRHELNFRIQLFASMVVFVSAWLFNIRRSEIIVLSLLVLLVLILELLNSAVEKIIDVVKPRRDLHAEQVKDIMAAAVLVASLGAGSIGVVIFWPYVVEYFMGS